MWATEDAIKKLEMLRDECGMSYREMERRIGVSDSTISRILGMTMYDYVQCTYRPSWKSLNAILRYEHPQQMRLPGL